MTWEFSAGSANDTPLNEDFAQVHIYYPVATNSNHLSYSVPCTALYPVMTLTVPFTDQCTQGS
eukprot:1609258-Pyramimonas_sp.AAC.2